LALIVPHRLWGTIGLPLLAKLYIRLKDIGKLPAGITGRLRPSSSRPPS